MRTGINTIPKQKALRGGDNIIHELMDDGVVKNLQATLSSSQVVIIPLLQVVAHEWAAVSINQVI